MGRDDDKAAAPTSRRDDRDSHQNDRYSRRDDRDSRGKRNSSRTLRETSPKRLRDGKPTTERPYMGSHRLDTDGPTNNDQKSRRRLHDALPLEATPGTDTKVKSDVKNDPEGKGNRIQDGIKHSSDQRDVPRPRSYFQHDLRSTAGQGGRSHDQRTADHRRWNDQKDRYGDRAKDKEANDLVKKDSRSQTGRDENNTWRHDRFFEREAETEPARKRRTFTEKKRSVEREVAASGKELGSRYHQMLPGSARRDEREYDHLHKLDESEKPFDRADDRSEQSKHRFLDRVVSARTSYQTRDRYGGRGTRGRERYSKTYDDRSTSLPTERQWKHDAFDEVNRSPVSKNTEEQIAKIEALLAL